MREADFQKQVVDRAKSYGWRIWHVPTPMKPIGGNRFVPDARGRGLPDLLCIHDDPPRIIFAEVKNETNKLSDDQTLILGLLRAVSRLTLDVEGNRMIGVYIWRPAAMDLIEMILRSKVMSE